MKKEAVAGIAIVLFGIIVGGVGIATAGIGIGIPVIPIGVYLIWRGYARTKDPRLNIKPLNFEKSSKGKFGLGILLMLTGVATSTLFVGIPIFIYGAYLSYKGFWRA